jgi:hypothetical protein
MGVGLFSRILVPGLFRLALLTVVVLLFLRLMIPDRPLLLRLSLGLVERVLRILGRSSRVFLPLFDCGDRRLLRLLVRGDRLPTLLLLLIGAPLPAIGTRSC